MRLSAPRRGDALARTIGAAAAAAAAAAASAAAAAAAEVAAGSSRSAKWIDSNSRTQHRIRERTDEKDGRLQRVVVSSYCQLR